MDTLTPLSSTSRKIVLAGATGFAVVIRTETELILKSRWVAPQRLLQEGFEFRYPTLQETMKEIAK